MRPQERRELYSLAATVPWSIIRTTALVLYMSSRDIRDVWGPPQARIADIKWDTHNR